PPHHLHSFPTRRSSDLPRATLPCHLTLGVGVVEGRDANTLSPRFCVSLPTTSFSTPRAARRIAFAMARREEFPCAMTARPRRPRDRKSTRLNSSHQIIS